MNAGGVTVSYFEWLKNIQHVEQGRMTKRWEELSNKKLYQAITGDTVTKEAFNKLMDEHNLRGPKEIDIVRSALQEVISTSMQEQWEKALSLDINIRTAALSSAIDKVGNSYKESGILF